MSTPLVPRHVGVGQSGQEVNVIELPSVAVPRSEEGEVHTPVLGGYDPGSYSRA